MNLLIKHKKDIPNPVDNPDVNIVDDVDWVDIHLVSGTIAVSDISATGTASSSTFLRGDGSWAAPSGGSDPWTVVKLASDFTTSSATAVDVTGLSFTPTANQAYMFEALLMLRTATTTVNPRPGLAWATGLSDGTVQGDVTQSTTGRLTMNGNIGAAVLGQVGGLPNNSQSWPATIWGNAIAGASPSGSVRIQLASETAGTNVTIKAGSYLRYRTY
jgi:hypothetical protein